MSDREVKLIIIGAPGVGKTSLLQQFSTGVFDSSTPTTIGYDFKVVRRLVFGKSFSIKIYDTAGLERYNCLTPAFYRGCHGVVFVYSQTDRGSYESVIGWNRDFEAYCTESSCSKLLVCNKNDLTSEAVVSQAEGVRTAREILSMFIEASALSGHNVEEAFMLLLERISLTYGDSLPFNRDVPSSVIRSSSHVAIESFGNSCSC